jgi:hypothetical protein
MSEVFDTGRIKMTKVADIQALARCRKILCSNCINGYGASVHMSSRTYGVEHIPFIMRTPEDVRRLDYVIPFKVNEEVNRQIHTHVTTTPIEGGYQEAAQCIVRWCWSRRAHQVRILRESERYAIERANTLSEKYSDDIPLLGAGDARIKIMRMAVAIAGQCFSSDESGEILIVDAGHVEAAITLLQALYDLEDCEFHLYSELRGTRSLPSHDDLKLLNDKLSFKGFMFRFEAFELIRDSPSMVSVALLAEGLQETREVVGEFVRELRRFNLVERTGSSYRTTSRGIFALKKWLADVARIEAGLEPIAMNIEPENWRAIKARREGSSDLLEGM